jgi:DnaJ-domain-containing protein 1
MSSVDQLFDRFGDLLRSWTQSGDKPFSDPDRNHGSRFTADPMLDEAMAELDAFLDDDKEEQERLRREAEARQRARESARPSGYRQPSGPPEKLVAAYKTLGLSYGATFDQAKAAYKRLLKEHHPDRHGSAPEAQKKATETSARINDAFRIIETWHDTGTMGDE